MRNIRVGRQLVLVLVATVQLSSQGLNAKQRPDGDLQAQNRPIVRYPSYQGISPPLWETDAFPGTPSLQGEFVRNIPWRRTRPPLVSLEPDSVLQVITSATPLVSTTNVFQFDGIPNLSCDVPPDSNAAVGRTQIVENVNEWLGVYSKDGTQLLLNGLGKIAVGIKGPCDPSDQQSSGRRWGDPVVLYDKGADRWIASYLANLPPSQTWYLCQGVSMTPDATGAWNTMAFAYPPQNVNHNGTVTLDTIVPDYPKLGVWPDAYYGTYNMIDISTKPNTLLGAQVCAFDRGAFLSGGRAQSVCFQMPATVESLLPADLDGSRAPDAGEPNFLAGIASPSALNLYRFHVDFAFPFNSGVSVPYAIGVASFSEACGGGACIPQNGTSQSLDSLGDRLMHRLAYRNFGDHESLVASHSVAAGGVASVRWYEIRCPNGNGTITTGCPGGVPYVFQQGTLPTDGNYRWMGSVAMDGSGNVALGYSVSGMSLYPSIRFTGRAVRDAPGQMQAESTILTGQGSQFGFSCDADPNCAARWGDYTSMAIDPADDATFVYTNEYYQAAGATCSNGVTPAFWHTRIASFSILPQGAGMIPEDPHVGTPLTATPATGSNMTLSWGSSCKTGDTDYEVYEGAIGSYYSHAEKLCSTGGTTSATFAAPATSTYYLVVPKNNTFEGSYGHSKRGTVTAEIVQGSPACMTQGVAMCP